VAACSPGTGTAAACCKDNIGETHALSVTYSMLKTTTRRMKIGKFGSSEAVCWAITWLPEKESRKQGPPVEEQQGRLMKITPGLFRGRLERIGFVRVPHKAAVVHIKKARTVDGSRTNTSRDRGVDVSILLLWQNVGEEKHTTKKTARRMKICCNLPPCCTWKRLRHHLGRQGEMRIFICSSDYRSNVTTD
jgi:hypothetical protein